MDGSERLRTVFANKRIANVEFVNKLLLTSSFFSSKGGFSMDTTRWRFEENAFSI